MGIALASIMALAFAFNPVIAWLLVPLFGLVYGYYERVYFAISMRATDIRIAASMFAVLMAVANIGTAIGLGLAGAMVDLTGFRWTFIILALMKLLGLPLLPAIINIEKTQPAE